MELPTKRHGGRFVALPGGAGTEADPHLVLFLDDVVRAGAAELFPAYAQVQVNSLKLSRDAELDIAEEVSGDLMAKIKSSLAKRVTGYPARLLYDPATPREVLRAIKQKTGIEEAELVEGSRYHNFRDFFGFPDFGRKDLLNPVWPELPHPTLPRTGPLLPVLAQRDHLLHPPYQSFDVVPRLLREAAHDPQVSAISITLYRVAPKSAVAKALLKAVKNGKQVTVVVELKARFDEESNIHWAEKLRRAGAHVILTPPELKCHAKLLLITRRAEADDQPEVGVSQPQRYAYLSSGNFNEATAHLYADHGLFTGQSRNRGRGGPGIPLLHHGRGAQPPAPFAGSTFHPAQAAAQAHRRRGYPRQTRRGGAYHSESQFTRRPRHDCRALRGQPGRGAHRAAHSGHWVPAARRGGPERHHQPAGAARPLPWNTPASTCFGNGGEEKVYLSSADWMSRNLNRRVEVAFPILDEGLRAEIRHLLDLERQDNVKARDFANQLPTPPAEGEPVVRAQEAQRQYLQKLARRRKPRPKA